MDLISESSAYLLIESRLRPADLTGSNGLVRGVLGWMGSEHDRIPIASGPSITPLVSVQGLGDPSGVGIGTATKASERPNRVSGQPCRASGANSTTYLNPNMFTANGFQLGTDRKRRSRNLLRAPQRRMWTWVLTRISESPNTSSAIPHGVFQPV